MQFTTKGLLLYIVVALAISGAFSWLFHGLPQYLYDSISVALIIGSLWICISLFASPDTYVFKRESKITNIFLELIVIALAIGLAFVAYPYAAQQNIFMQTIIRIVQVILPLWLVITISKTFKRAV